MLRERYRHIYYTFSLSFFLRNSTLNLIVGWENFGSYQCKQGKHCIGLHGK